jgi:hypothetical protein
MLLRKTTPKVLQVRSPHADSGREILFVVGPESTATRVFTSLLSRHVQIQGTRNAEAHGDLFDEVWAALRNAGQEAAARAFPIPEPGIRYLLTRRSLPHGPAPGEPARFMDFADIEGFQGVAASLGYQTTLLVTVRSVYPNLISWAEARASAHESIDKAYAQYNASYRHVFRAVENTGMEFVFLSLEALMLDGASYLNALFQFLRLPPQRISFRPNTRVNRKHYSRLP